MDIKDISQNTREYNLDLLKAFAIIFMVICHPMLCLGEYIEGHENNFWYFFGDVILGDYFVGAHGFMLAMGVGIVFSRNNTPQKIILRGIKIYFLAYVFNFFRYGIYSIGYYFWGGILLEEAIYAIIFQDILQFAGIALITTGIFKALKLNEKHIFLIALMLSTITTFIPNIDMKSTILNALISTFVYTTKEDTYFCFFNWYIFVATGILFGKTLKKIKNKHSFYVNLFKIFFPLMFLYILLSFKYGAHFLTRDTFYYVASPLEALGFLSIDFSLLSIFYFLLEKFDVSKFKIFIGMSKNLTKIYIIHWLILGFIDAIFFTIMGYKISYLQIYLFSIALLIVSVYLADVCLNKLPQCKHLTNGT